MIHFWFRVGGYFNKWKFVGKYKFIQRVKKIEYRVSQIRNLVFRERSNIYFNEGSGGEFIKLSNDINTEKNARLRLIRLNLKPIRKTCSLCWLRSLPQLTLFSLASRVFFFLTCFKKNANSSANGGKFSVRKQKAEFNRKAK